tara:strand:- start:187 stop:354 length:168 start_codon:yes stop_codon:yes gene_type:complete
LSIAIDKIFLENLSAKKVVPGGPNINQAKKAEEMSAIKAMDIFDFLERFDIFFLI